MIRKYLGGGGDDDERKNNQKKDELTGPESGDYHLPDDIGERIGEQGDHDPTTLGNV